MAISVSFARSCAIVSGGNLYCWGATTTALWETAPKLTATTDFCYVECFRGGGCCRSARGRDERRIRHVVPSHDPYTIAELTNVRRIVNSLALHRDGHSAFGASRTKGCRPQTSPNASWRLRRDRYRQPLRSFQPPAAFCVWVTTVRWEVQRWLGSNAGMTSPELDAFGRFS